MLPHLRISSQQMNAQDYETLYSDEREKRSDREAVTATSEFQRSMVSIMRL